MIIGVSGRVDDVDGIAWGSAGAGKSEVAKRLVEKHGFVEVSLADEIKRIAARLWRFTDDQLWGPSECRNALDVRYPTRCHGCQTCEFRCDHANGFLTPRRALQQIGTEIARAVDQDVWVRYTLRVAMDLLRPDAEQPGYTREQGLNFRKAGVSVRGVVIADVRFPNEVDHIRAVGGKMWQKRRVVPKPEVIVNHVSETALLRMPEERFDAVFLSGDLSQLQLLIDRTMDTYSGKLRQYDPEQADIPPFKRS